MKDLPNLALACYRTGVSERNASLIANAVLRDYNITGSDKVIVKTKIRREKEKLTRRIDSDISKKSLKSLYFDGRKDSTKMQTKIDKKFYKKTVKQEHVTLLEEPESKYITHLSPVDGTAKCISDSIYEYFQNEEIDLSELTSIGCDGCPSNTGNKGGIIHLLERKLNRPLQWFVCQLHGVELQLRHVFEHLDGRKVGPKGFSGPISKSLNDCENLSVQNFEIIKTNIPPVKIADLSSDQKCLLELGIAINSGHCSSELALKKLGPISHSRWLTTACRILRVYIGTDKPNKKLKVLTEFVMKVYLPVWFAIKCNPYCYNGAHNVWLSISLSRQFDKEIKRIIDPVIQRNSFFGHSENILLAMTVDPQLTIRQRGLEMILKSRRNKNSGQPRIFSLESFKFDACDYTHLIDWDKCVITEPPILSHISDNDLKFLVLEKHNDLKKLLNFPCHTQSVERTIKLVTEASESVYGFKTRDNLIRAKLKSRQNVPSFSSKKDYLLLQ